MGASFIGPPAYGLTVCAGGYVTRYFLLSSETAHQSPAMMICQAIFVRSAADWPWFLTVASMVAVMVPCGVQTALPLIELITRSDSAAGINGPPGGVVEDCARPGWVQARPSASVSAAGST